MLKKFYTIKPEEVIKIYDTNKKEDIIKKVNKV